MMDYFDAGFYGEEGTFTGTANSGSGDVYMPLAVTGGSSKLSAIFFGASLHISV